MKSRAQILGLGIAMGAGIGAAMMSATNMAAWLPIGIGVGLAIASGVSNRNGACQTNESRSQKAKS